jgi:hypothetical protein
MKPEGNVVWYLGNAQRFDWNRFFIVRALPKRLMDVTG